MWEPATILSINSPNFIYSLIVLNQPIESSLYSRLRKTAVDVVCADGGANRVFDMESNDGIEDRAPDFICGDMDSLRPAVEKAFTDVGTKLVKDEDQYATDFIKALRVVNNEIKSDRPHSQYRTGRRLDTEEQRKKVASGETSLNVVVLGGLGGRADQAFSQLHHLYAASIDPSLDQIGHIYLVAEESIIFLLDKGSNRIETPVEPRRLTENIGIIPLGMSSTITTHGLEWDVTDWKTSFGTQISTSNHIRDSRVEVITSERVLFTVQIDHGLTEDPSTEPSTVSRIGV